MQKPTKRKHHQEKQLPTLCRLYFDALEPAPSSFNGSCFAWPFLAPRHGFIYFCLNQHVISCARTDHLPTI